MNKNVNRNEIIELAELYKNLLIEHGGWGIIPTLIECDVELNEIVNFIKLYKFVEQKNGGSWNLRTEYDPLDDLFVVEYRDEGTRIVTGWDHPNQLWINNEWVESPIHPLPDNSPLLVAWQRLLGIAPVDVRRETKSFRSFIASLEASEGEGWFDTGFPTA